MQPPTTHPKVPPGLPPDMAREVSKVLSRRNLLGTLGVAAVGGALTMVSYRDDAQAATPPKNASSIKGAKDSGTAQGMDIDPPPCAVCRGRTTAYPQRHRPRPRQT